MRGRDRFAGLTLVAAGVAHLLAPRALLWLAGVGYRRVLGVRFQPTDAAPRRVRAVGAGMVAAGVALLAGRGRKPG